MYATVPQFVAWLSGKGQRIQQYFRVDEDQIATQATVALDAAAAYMDSAFQEGGYIVPIDVDSVSDPTERAQLAALLSDRNCALALKECQLSMDAMTELATQTAAEAVGWLNSIRGVKGFDDLGTLRRLFAVSSLPGVQRVA